jgi:protein-disulfide isomerase
MKHARWTVLIALLLGGCAGEAPSLSGAAPSTATATGLGLSPEEVATSGSAVPSNPFIDGSTETRGGGREVIANPTLAEILEPSPLPEMAFGRADAPVTIVEYASLTCPYCKRFHAEVYPVLKRDYIDTGKVRYILRDFPIGRTSGQASVALRCASPDKYLDLYGRFLADQPSWVSQDVRVDAIAAVAAKSGLTRTDYEACRQNTALVEGLKAEKDRGRKLGIIGTPNFFIQDKRVKKALDIGELRAMIDPLLADRTAQATAPKP